MPKRRYEVIRYKVKEPRVQVLNPLTQRWVYKPYSTAYYSHQCTNDPAPNHNAINEAPGANHEESRSKSRQRLAKEVAMIFNAAYGAAQGRSAPLPFPYKRHKAKPVVEVMGLPANQNVPGVLRYPRSYGLHYLKQLVAGKTAIAMKLINKDSPPAVSPPPTVAAPPPPPTVAPPPPPPTVAAPPPPPTVAAPPPPPTVAAPPPPPTVAAPPPPPTVAAPPPPPTVAAPPPPPTVALPPPQEKGLPLSIEMLTVPALKSDNVDTEVEAEEIEMSEAAAAIALEKIRQLLGVQKQEGLAVLGVAPAKAAVKKVYKRRPLSVEEKAALQETFSSGELPSRAVLERCMASHDLLKKRQFKQCYNYLHKKKLKANRLLPRK